jgi:hypothetical protein
VRIHLDLLSFYYALLAKLAKKLSERSRVSLNEYRKSMDLKIDNLNCINYWHFDLYSIAGCPASAGAILIRSFVRYILPKYFFIIYGKCCQAGK